MWGGVLGDGQSAGYVSWSMHSPGQSSQSPGGVVGLGETWLALWMPGGQGGWPSCDSFSRLEVSANKAACLKT